MVSDEGGEIDSNFAPFVLLHRQGLERPLSFYDFAPDVEKPTENSGIGTFTMHMVAHEVRYWLNKWGGLSVQLRLLNNKGTAAPVI